MRHRAIDRRREIEFCRRSKCGVETPIGRITVIDLLQGRLHLSVRTSDQVVQQGLSGERDLAHGFIVPRTRAGVNGAPHQGHEHFEVRLRGVTRGFAGFQQRPREVEFARLCEGTAVRATLWDRIERHRAIGAGHALRVRSVFCTTGTA